MERPRRTHAEARAQMREGIVRLGNEQLERVGASALSVRKIARELGVASSAIYRHVAHRDELLTLLLVDAYSELADAALTDDDVHAPTGVRLRTLATGMREWAVAHPARWALAYGSPVPGYQAPAAQTTPPGTRVMVVFFALIGARATPGTRRFDVSDPLAPAEVLSGELSSVLDAAASEFGLSVDSPRAAAALEAWTGLIGLISAEVFGHLGPDLSMHGEELLARWASSVIERFALAG